MNFMEEFFMNGFWKRIFLMLVYLGIAILMTYLIIVGLYGSIDGYIALQWITAGALFVFLVMSVYWHDKKNLLVSTTLVLIGGICCLIVTLHFRCVVESYPIVGSQPIFELWLAVIYVIFALLILIIKICFLVSIYLSTPDSRALR